MALVGEPKQHPRMSGQHPDIMPGSPLAVLALFTEIVRERFRPGSGLAWVWKENPTPEENETGQDDAPRTILIEPSFSETAETRNFCPAIYVDRKQVVAEKVVINNFVAQKLNTGLKAFYSQGTIPITIEVVSNKKGESATLADIVWFYILAGREQIRKTFGLHELTNPVLGETVPDEKDKQQFVTPITFTIQIDIRWITKPMSPLLKEIVARFKQSGETNPDTFLLKSYIK